jgi:hypothetical protein
VIVPLSVIRFPLADARPWVRSRVLFRRAKEIVKMRLSSRCSKR